MYTSMSSLVAARFKPEPCNRYYNLYSFLEKILILLSDMPDKRWSLSKILTYLFIALLLFSFIHPITEALLNLKPLNL